MSSRTPRVAIASRIFPPEAGAASFRLAALVDALEDSGHETTVFTTQPREHVRGTRRVRRFPVLRNKSGAVRGYLQYASFDVPLFFRLLFARKFDLIVVEPPPTTGVAVRLVGWLRRTRYAYFAADVSSVAAAGIGVNRGVVRILRRVESWVMRGAGIVLSVSSGVEKELLKLGVEPLKIAVVGTGVDTAIFHSDGERATFDGQYFVYAGTMSEIQGASVFVDAFADVAPAHPDLHLLLFGQGTQEDELRRKAVAVSEDRIHFGGLVSGTEVASWFRGAVAGLASMAPAHGYDFAYSTKAFASLACGTPVIYAGSGVSGDVIREHHLGWSVGWNTSEVAAAMQAALEAHSGPAQPNNYSAWVSQNHSLRRVAQNSVDALDRFMVHDARMSLGSSQRKAGRE